MTLSIKTLSIITHIDCQRAESILIIDALNVIMLSAITISVVMLNVVAPLNLL